MKNTKDDIQLQLATEKDAELIQRLKYKSFLPIYDIYKDDETNPIMEPIEKTISILQQAYTDYWLIKYQEEYIGAIRIGSVKQGVYHISPVYIVPEYQNIGVGTIILEMMFEKYSNAEMWTLTTIKEELRNCHFYEKLGFVRNEYVKVVNDKMTLVGYDKIV